MKTMFQKFATDTKGATAIEYGLIAALIAVAAITAMGSLGNQIGDTMNTTTGEMATATARAPGSQ